MTRPLERSRRWRAAGSRRADAGAVAPCSSRRGVDHGDAEPGAADEPVDRVVAVHAAAAWAWRRWPSCRRAPQAAAISLNSVEVRRVLGHHDQRLGRCRAAWPRTAPRARTRRQLVRMHHGHDEVDVGQLLLQRRHLLDVGERCPGGGRGRRGRARRGSPSRCRSTTGAGGRAAAAGRRRARPGVTRARRRGERVVDERRRQMRTRVPSTRAPAFAQHAPAPRRAAPRRRSRLEQPGASPDGRPRSRPRRAPIGGDRGTRHARVLP